MVRIDDLLKRLDELIAQGQQTLLARDDRAHGDFVDTGKMAGFRSASLSFIERVYGGKHPHFVQFTQFTQHSYIGDASRGLEILKSIRSEISGGWLFTVKSLITAEVFADFLEMSDHLLANNYKDSAAVMIGSVLEEHLRQLCIRHEIDTEEERSERRVHKKADTLNAELAKAEVYNKLDQKQITAWLDLRNKAAHGKYEEYSIDQVRQLHSGVTEFMARVSL